MSSSYLNIFGGQVIYPSYVSYLAINLTSNTTLSWPSDFQNSNLVVSSIMNVTESAGGFSLTLPDATQVSVGQSFLLNNVGAHSFALKANDGSTILSPVNAGTISYFYLTDNTTVAGQWIYTAWGAGGSSITSVGLDPSGTSGNITVTPAYLSPGNPITTTGVFTLMLGNDLAALSGFGAGTGIAVRTSNAPTWSLIGIAGTANQINVANPTGVAGNPTISLASNITGVQSITAGNIMIGGAGANANNISSINPAGNINFTTVLPGIASFEMNVALHPAGVTGGTLEFYNPANTHYFSMAGGNVGANVLVTLPTTAPTINQVLYCAVGGSPAQLGWANTALSPGVSTLDAIARFTDNLGSIGDSGVFIDNSNNITGANSLTLPDLQLSNNVISTLIANDPLLLSPNGTGNVQLPIGTGLLPGIAFIGATTTGIYTVAGVSLNFTIAGVPQAQVGYVFNAVNTIRIAGGTSGNPVTIGALGANPNVSIQLNPKGTGALLNAAGTGTNPSYSFSTDSASGMYSSIAGEINWATNATPQMTLDSNGNLGIGINTFGTSSASVLSLLQGSAPTTAVASSTQIFASLPSGGNTSIGWYGQGNGGVTNTAASTVFTKNIAVIINGTTYYIPAKTTDT